MCKCTTHISTVIQVNLLKYQKYLSWFKLLQVMILFPYIFFYISQFPT